MVVLTLSLSLLAHAEDEPEPTSSPPPSMSELLEQSPASDWETIPAANLLLLTLGEHQVVMELAPAVAPKNVANIRTLASEGYYDDLPIVRSHDNYVVQWADPAEDEAETEARPLGSAKARVKGEFDHKAKKLTFVPLDSEDAYADQVGFVGGMPAGSDGERTWLTHCYGAVGVARANETNSGNGSSLYVVTGHAPRHLDRNITVVGRVIDGIEALSALPRGSGPLGFYEDPAQYVPITSVELTSEMPADQRPTWQRLRPDSATFQAVLASRTTRTEDWFAYPVGKIGVCNVPLPRRRAP